MDKASTPPVAFSAVDLLRTQDQRELKMCRDFMERSMYFMTQLVTEANDYFMFSLWK